ncbi:MAG: hypothetical protein H7067_03450, partial [Burkholderiales bacterium]|nr:hypothetical protein [Opitutaceae bacterium]
ETGLGHAAAAQALWDEARRLQAPAPGDAFDLRHARSRLTWGDFYPAETAFRAALETAPDDAASRGSLIGLLIAMDRLERAEAEAMLWWTREPESPEAQTALARYLMRVNPVMAGAFREEMFPKAKVAPPAEPDALTTAFRTAGPEGTRTPEFLLAYTADADRYHAKGEPLPTGFVIPASAATLVQLAGLYAGQGDFELTIRCFRAARLADSENFSAWIGLAEFLAIAQHYEEAHREFAALAVVFPTNRQVLLKQARALGWGRRYEDSLVAYTALRALNPADPVPLLEQARVAGWAKRREHASELYALRWADPVDARLRAGLRPLLTTFDPEPVPEVLATWLDLIAPAAEPDADEDYLDATEPFALAERFEAEITALSAVVPPETAAALERLRLDLRADFRLQRAFWLENRAKQLAWDRRWWRSEQTYDRLLAISPGNQEALFDLSQVQAAQGLGDRERVTLGRLLAIDANNRLASAALFRRERRSEPLAFGQLDYYRERGRDDLSSIRRLRTGFGGETMIDNRFRLRGALLRWRESPYTTSEDFRARGFSIGAEGVFANWLTASAEYIHKDDTGPGIGDVDTGGAQAWVPFKDAVRVGAGVEVREELANEFAYFQGIRSTHHWLGAEAALSRRAEIAARADFIDYADENSGSHFWIAPAYTWTEHPRTFKTTVTFEARDTDEANVYQFVSGDLVDITHPYWTPQDYRGVALTLEWRHDLAKDFFIGAQEHWYDVRVTFGASNDSNQGVSWAADYAREWRDRWVLRLGFAQTFSEQWDDFRAQARLAFRF